MKTIKVKAICETGFAGATHRDTLEIEVPESATDEQIESIVGEEVKEWAMNWISIGYEIIK